MFDFMARDIRHFVVQVLFVLFKIFPSTGTVCIAVVSPIIVVTDTAPRVARNVKLCDSVAVLQVCFHMAGIIHMYFHMAFFFVQRR